DEAAGEQPIDLRTSDAAPVMQQMVQILAEVLPDQHPPKYPDSRWPVGGVEVKRRRPPGPQTWWPVHLRSEHRVHPAADRERGVDQAEPVARLGFASRSPVVHRV